MDDVKERLLNYNIDSLAYKDAAKLLKNERAYLVDMVADLYIPFDSNMYLTFIKLKTVWPTRNQLQVMSEYVFTPSSKSIEQSRIYKRQTLQSYYSKVEKSPKHEKYKDGRVDISNVKKYITLDEFPVWFVKMQLAIVGKDVVINRLPSFVYRREEE